MQLFTATSVKNRCKFLTILLQQKLALLITKIFKQKKQSYKQKNYIFLILTMQKKIKE